MSTMQLSYNNLLVWDDAKGYSTYLDYLLFVVFITKRMGYWISHEWRDGALEALTWPPCRAPRR